MGVVCSTYGRLERCIQGFSGGDLRERRNLGDLRVNVKMIIIKKNDVPEVEWGHELDCCGSG